MNYSPVVSTTVGTLMAANFITRLKPQGAKTGAHVRQLTNQIALGHVITQPRVCERERAGENDRRKELSVRPE